MERLRLLCIAFSAARKQRASRAIFKDETVGPKKPFAVML
jgi:hypothetical protein